MSRLINKIRNSDFLKNVFVVMTGTATAQLIALALTPILTRNYSPEDFGYYTTYLAIYSIIASFATGKYERTFFLLRRERHIKVVSSLALYLSILLSALVLLLVIILRFFDVTFLGVSSIFMDWLYLMPFMVLFHGINIILLTFLNYKGLYKIISTFRVLKTITSVGVSLLCIFFLKNMGGLILGEALGLFISTSYLLVKYKNIFGFDKLSLKLAPIFAKKYINFPKYNIPSDILNTSSNQLPPFFLTYFHGPGVTGQYSLMKKILDAPISLLSSSILEVFRQKASEQYLYYGNCRELFVKTAKNLIIISILPFSILLLWGTDIFVFLFGNEWYDAGIYAGIFAVFYFFKFVSSPLSYIFYIAEKQKTDFIIHIYMFISSVLIFWIPSLFQLSVTNIFWIYTINFVFIYLVFFSLSYKYSKK